MRVLILYATRQGQTAKVAAQIARHLGDAHARVELLNARDAETVENLDLEAFDLLVFGASMHAGGLERELVRFIECNRDRIAAKSRSFFLVLLSAATRDPQLRADSLADARAKMDRQLAVPFDDVEMIAGALTYSKYP